MNCKICSTDAQTVTTWRNSNPEHRKPDVYSVWRCGNGHHFYTLSKWEGKRYKTDLVRPEDMQFIKYLL